VFMEAVNSELLKANYFTLGKITSFVSTLHGLRANVREGVQESLAHVDKLGGEISLLDRYTTQNTEGFRKILKKYQKVTGRSVIWFHAKQADQSLYKAVNVIHELVVQLSRVREVIVHGENPDVEEAVWVPPTSFERVTTKYWVKQENITALKTYTLRHVPILEINESKEVDLEFFKQGFDQTHNFISSVYLDSEHLDCYHDRIMQNEGAQLFRIRWYGGKVDKDSGCVAVVPSSENRYLFFERKTHHESWVEEKSKKERFMIDRALLPAFMSGELDVKREFQNMLKLGIVKDGDFLYQVNLALECQSAVVKRKLTPKIRTTYHRTAFQSPKSNQVRLSLDNPLFLFKEMDVAHRLEALAAFWKKPNGPGGLQQFDYGVLEIKIQGAAPPWVNDLLAKDWLIPVAKFSKFQHAIASNFSNLVKITPYWFANEPEPSEMNLESGEVVIPAGADSNGLAVGRGAIVRRKKSHKVNQVAPEKMIAAEAAGSRQSVVAVKKTNLVRAKVEPKTFFANERTFIQWLSAALLLVTLSSAIMTINEEGRIAGTIMWPIGILLVLYSIWTYHWRLKKLKARDGSRFDDPYGPTVLAFMLVCAMIAVLVVSWTNAANEAGGAQVTVEGPLGGRHNQRARRDLLREPIITDAMQAKQPDSFAGLFGKEDDVANVAAAAVSPCTLLTDPSLQKCPIQFDLALVHDRLTVKQDVIWPKQCFNEKFTRERSINDLEHTLSLLHDRKIALGACIDLEVVPGRQVVHEQTEAHASGSSARLVHRLEKNTLSLFSPTVSPHPSDTGEAVQYKVWESHCNFDTPSVSEMFVVDMKFSKNETRTSPKTMAQIHFSHFFDNVNRSASGWSAFLSATWKTKFMTLVKFNLTVGGVPATLTVELEYPTSLARALAVEPTDVHLSIVQTGVVTQTSVHQSGLLIELLSRMAETLDECTVPQKGRRDANATGSASVTDVGIAAPAESNQMSLKRREPAFTLVLFGALSITIGVFLLSSTTEGWVSIKLEFRSFLDKFYKNGDGWARRSTYDGVP